MRLQHEYHFDCSADPAACARRAGEVFAAVWRTDFTAPGFALIDLGTAVDSHGLRGRMVQLKETFDAFAVSAGRHFAPRSVGRFDQQVTTKFHLDGAPEESLLVLGYEPSAVASRVALADYTRCAFDLGVSAAEFLIRFNPMFADGESRLRPYVTEPVGWRPDHFHLLLINNSSRSFEAGAAAPLGVMHRAVVPEPDESKRRVVNSMMLVSMSRDEAAAVDAAALAEFVRTDRLSPKVGAA